MIEVFRTNVEDCDQANMLIGLIHDIFIDYTANFDLQDCDNILRVECRNGPIEAACLIQLLNQHGYDAEVLEDEINPRIGRANHNVKKIIQQ